MSDAEAHPSANGGNGVAVAGRDPRTGRFLPGNAGGPGNPHVGKVARLKAALLEAVDEEDVRDVIVAMVERARNGDVAAAKVILDRTIGPADKSPEDAPADLDTVLRGTLRQLPEPIVRQMRDLWIKGLHSIGKAVPAADAAGSTRSSSQQEERSAVIGRVAPAVSRGRSSTREHA